MYYSLNPGDKIGLVSPSRSVKPAEIAYGVNYLKSLGFEVIFGEHVFDKFRYMAGTAENRAADIMQKLVLLLKKRKLKLFLRRPAGTAASLFRLF